MKLPTALYIESFYAHKNEKSEHKSKVREIWIC